MSFDLPNLPNTITSPQVKNFLAKYYEISNSAPSHDEYADLFTSDGEFGINDKKAKGRQEIYNLRKAIWSHVPGREHRPVQIYTHGDDQMDLMILGDVKYKHHAGHETDSDWAVKMQLVEEEKELKVAYYHIIVDSKAHL